MELLMDLIRGHTGQRTPTSTCRRSAPAPGRARPLRGRRRPVARRHSARSLIIPHFRLTYWRRLQAHVTNLGASSFLGQPCCASTTASTIAQNGTGGLITATAARHPEGQDPRLLTNATPSVSFGPARDRAGPSDIIAVASINHRQTLADAENPSMPLIIDEARRSRLRHLADENGRVCGAKVTAPGQGPPPRWKSSQTIDGNADTAHRATT